MQNFNVERATEIEKELVLFKMAEVFRKLKLPKKEDAFDVNVFIKEVTDYLEDPRNPQEKKEELFAELCVVKEEYLTANKWKQAELIAKGLLFSAMALFSVYRLVLFPEEALTHVALATTILSSFAVIAWNYKDWFSGQSLCSSGYRNQTNWTLNSHNRTTNNYYGNDISFQEAQAQQAEKERQEIITEAGVWACASSILVSAKYFMKAYAVYKTGHEISEAFRDHLRPKFK